MKKINELINNADRILIISHKRPDGDSIGSQAGLAAALHDAGKQVSVYNADPVPEMFRFLKASSYIENEFKEAEYDLVIFLDCADIDRPGKIMKEIGSLIDDTVTVNIDHHVSNTGFAAYNHVETEASSTSEIVYRLLKMLGYSISEDSATALLCGLITDTGFFKFNNVNHNTLSMASDIMSMGGDLFSISMHAYMERPIEKMHLLSRVFDRIKINNNIALSYIKETDFTELDAKSEYTDGLVNEILYIRNITGSILCIEDGPGVRISFRSKDGIDMNELASHYGGGGHINAAGAYVKDGLMHVLERLSEDIKEL